MEPAENEENMAIANLNDSRFLNPGPKPYSPALAVWFQREASGRRPMSSSAARTVAAHEAPRTFGGFLFEASAPGAPGRVVKCSCEAYGSFMSEHPVSIRQDFMVSRSPFVSSTQLPKEAMVGSDAGSPELFAQPAASRSN